MIISKEGRIQLQKEFLDFTNIDKLLKRILASKYLKGVDEIEIKVNSLEKSRLIQKRVSEMIGMEVVEQDKNRLLIKDISGGTEDNFDTIVKRVLYLLHSLSEDILKAIKNKDVDLQYLKDIELNINKFTDYCFRLLNKKGYTDSKKTAILYCILFNLELLGDGYKEIINYIMDNRLKLSEELIRLYEEINYYYQDFEKLFLKFDFESSINLAQKRDSLIKTIKEQIKTSKSVKDVAILKNFEEIIETIVRMMGQLLNLY